MKITNILVVEDERITAKDIKNSLEKAGYNVPAMVATGEDAIQFTDENRPDLVIMDIKLEGNIDGIDAAETIRSKFSIPVIYLTSYSDKNTIERARSTHPSAFILKEPFGFLHKPFEEGELLSAIDIILYRNNEENTLKNHEKLISSVLKTISDGVVITDLNGRIKFLNIAAENLTGHLEQDLIGKNLMEIMPGINLKKETPDKSDLVDLFDGKCLLKSKNNEYISIDGTTTPLIDEKDNNSGIIIIFRDTI